MKNISLLLLLILLTSKLFGQYPWERPLKTAWSNDGITFNAPTIFQDSSGVPSLIKWKGDTLICAFQWFRVPIGSPSWDRVAVKFSYDNGITWTQPIPIVVNGLPPNYQRPFDPTLVIYNSDSIRIYFSSSDGFPIGGLDSTVNTYSAKSIDGINYTFDTGASKMSDSEKKSACQQKRTAEKSHSKVGTGNKPKMVSYKPKNEGLTELIRKVLRESF
jgi:hypothetical protein